MGWRKSPLPTRCRRSSSARSQLFAGTLLCMKVIDHTISDFKRNARTNSLVIEQIEAGMTAFNEAVCPDPTEAPLTLSIQNKEGEVVAGLLGSNAYGWLRVDIVWVDERHRGKGFGRALLDRAEQIGLERGCDGIHLDTQSFQAPKFYEKLGYEPFGELESYPGENKRIYLRKSLLRKP
jgi:GNAT superfamily N-acetyltransferase